MAIVGFCLDSGGRRFGHCKCDSHRALVFRLSGSGSGSRGFKSSRPDEMLQWNAVEELPYRPNSMGFLYTGTLFLKFPHTQQTFLV